MKQARRWQIAIPLILVLALAALVTALVMRDVVRQFIVLPLSYIVWLVGLVVNSFPQSTYWAVVVAAVALVAWRAIAAPLRSASSRQDVSVVTRHVARSRLAERQRVLGRMGESAFARERVAFDLRALVVQTLAWQEHQPEEEIEQRIRARSIDLPADVQTLMTDWQNWLSDPPANRWQRSLRALRERFVPKRGLQSDKQRKATPATSGYLRQVAAVIDYLDTQCGGTDMGHRFEELKEGNGRNIET